MSRSRVRRGFANQLHSCSCYCDPGLDGKLWAWALLTQDTGLGNKPWEQPIRWWEWRDGGGQWSWINAYWFTDGIRYWALLMAQWLPASHSLWCLTSVQETFRDWLNSLHEKGLWARDSMVGAWAAARMESYQESKGNPFWKRLLQGIWTWTSTRRPILSITFGFC